MEYVDTGGEAPIPLELPGHARTEEPVGTIEAGNPSHLRIEFVGELVIQEEAIATLVAVGNQGRVVIEERALEHLRVQSRICRQIKIQANRRYCFFVLLYSSEI